MLLVLVQAVSIYASISLTASRNKFITLNIYQPDSDIFHIIDTEEIKQYGESIVK